MILTFKINDFEDFGVEINDFGVEISGCDMSHRHMSGRETSILQLSKSMILTFKIIDFSVEIIEFDMF